MRMGMGMSMRPALRQTLSLSQKFVMLQAHMLSLRLMLLQEVRGIRYSPSGDCPKCGRVLTPLEIIKGFNEDPHDFTTACTACGARFEPQMKSYSDIGTLEMPFFCSCQTLDQLRSFGNINPDELQKTQPAIYHSAIIHHGTLRNAFKKIGIPYGFDEVTDWKRKVHSFLGRLPDTVIADVAGVSAKVIAQLRKKYNISRCTREKMFEEAGDN